MKSKVGISSANQTLEILEYIVLSGREVSLKEIAEEIGLHVSTVHRYLSSLLEKGYVRKTQNGLYKPFSYRAYGKYKTNCSFDH